ncbi:histone-lysine N-methyltransferase ASHH2-like isoform X1 [Ipomoea triloba]|uniref:histone-lysine N-methyltransferase ASHH2-like isoform X1 n=1 Tax=Ipomoea triloba TaxID=35885 RepID=UPI00125DB75B|nr:histone-lysine N-methyltransferase ASHH2-like isoform X1 [Ipomoea triloba]
MNPNSAGGVKLSLSPKSTDEPFSERDERLSKCNASVGSQNDILVSALDSAIIVKVHEQRHEEGRDTINIDDAYERKCSDTVCMSPNKSNGPNVSKSLNQAKISGRGVTVAAVKKTPGHLKSLNITRRRRNICSKPAQPSVWRLLGDSLNGSEQSDRVEIIQQEPRESRRAIRGQKSEKQESNQTGQHSQKPMGKNHISLKVKFGNRCLMDVLPLIENGNEIYSSTEKESSKSADDISEEFTRTMGLDGLNGRLGNSLMLSDGSASNTCLAGSSLVENLAKEFLECHPELPTQMDLDKLGTPVDSRCLDPGTSPDSEVINITSDASISLKDVEYLPDIIANQDCFSSRDVSSLDAQEKGLKKGKKKDRPKKKDRLDKMSDISVKGVKGMFPGLKIMNTEFGPNSSDFGDSSALTTIGNTYGNVFSTELDSEGLLPSSGLDDFEISNAISEFELGEKVDVCCHHYTESPESKMTEKPLSSPDKLKLPKSRRYQGVGKSQPGICNSSTRRERASKRKGNKEMIVGKHEEKEKTLASGLSEVKNDQNTENQTPPHLEENGSRNGNMGVCVSNQSDTGTNYVLPRNAWVQCDDCHKWRRISVSLADKIEETNCRWSCKDNMDKDFADCSIPQEKSNAEINVELEISDVSEEEDAFDARHNCDNSGKKSAVAQSSTWTLIKSNLFLHRSRKSQTIDEIMICHCKPSDGRIGCGNECLNRMLNIECVQGTCPCGEQCSNQQFQRRNYAKLKWFKCGKKGYGLQLLEDVSKGCFIIEYVGEVLDMRVYEARQKEYALKDHKHFYFMTLNGSEVIDACAKGNLGRFINHSCDPNCRTEKWMANGEVCIGLFAIRDIKKGEELTFDYNYVRVFGAAAKKCVCGSPQCRGYIGGDPQNAEVIVQDDSDDEYPEPVVTCEEDDMRDELNNIKSAASPFRGSEMRSAKEAAENREVCSAECLKSTEVSGDLLNMSALRVDGAEKDLERSLCSPGELEVTSPTGTLSKPLRKSKSGRVGCKVPLVKTPRSLQKKPTSGVVNIKAPAEMDKSNMLQVKSKKLAEGSLNDRFEAVEEKLNELLDQNGGISKSKDASRSYLKLLLLTAASGDSGSSEAIQSNRELSMILGALLKTKSRTVLVDIINKNGLQMLHNIMKRYRREFNKTPILRKLLKVLEYLALREILTIDHINGVPSRPGVESFRDSILALTEHIDKQVHQIARNFRDRWVPKPPRKNSCMERDDERVEFHTGSRCNRSLSLQNHSVDCSKRLSETGCITQDGRMSDGSSGLGITNGTKKTRKRKSRWDQVPEIHDNGLQDIDDGAPPGYEVPPGFSPLINNTQEHCTGNQPVIGQSQQRFISKLPVSYGIPFNIVQQFGVPLNGSSESWAIAPGIPFHPFPPLPTNSRDRRGDTQTPLPSYPCDKINPTAVNTEALAQPTKTSIQNSHSSIPYHSAQNHPPSTSGANLNQDGENAELDHQHSGDPYGLGRKYFREQKWNGPKLGPPWLRMRNGRAPTGICNIAEQGATMVNEFKSWCNSEEASIGRERLGHPSHQS